MKLSIKLICFFCILQNIGLSQQYFYSVPESEIDLYKYIKEANYTQKVPSFSITDLITVREYKEYLNAVKKDSGQFFYEHQLPRSAQMSKELVLEILNSEDLQDEPMPGVIWSAARNYCKWKTNLSKEKGLNYYYDLPFLTEIIAYYELYGIQSNHLESWTLNLYEESYYPYDDWRKKNKLFDYYLHYDSTEVHYIANDGEPKYQPPSMKRKIIFGGSYNRGLVFTDKLKKIDSQFLNNLRYEYQDSTSRYVGFRIVKKIKNDWDKIPTYELNDYEKVYNSLIYKSYMDTSCYYIPMREFVVDEIRVKVGFFNNNFHGHYIEINENNETKTVGEFYNGQRVGVWSVFDLMGNLLVQRNYNGNLFCDYLYPHSDYPYEKLYQKHPPYEIKRNKQGFFPFVFLEARAVAYSKRYWRELNSINQVELFQQINLKELFLEMIDNNILFYFYGNSGDFRTELDSIELDSLKNHVENIDFSKIQLKEDYYYHEDYLIGKNALIGINFFEKNKPEPSYSIYYPNPDLRRLLRNYKLNILSINDIKNLDDFLYFGEYGGQISYNFDYYSKEQKRIDKYEALKLELKKYSTEHELWKLFGR